MNIDKLKKLVLNKMKKSEGEKEQLGNIFKSKRIMLSKTLEDISSGVCCVSYLSKFENNKAMLNTKQISGLIKKLELRENVIEEYKLSYEKVEEFINIMYFKDAKRIKNYKDKMKNYNDISSKVIKAGILLLENNINDLSKKLEELYLYREAMPNETLQLFLYLVCVNNFEKEKYLDSYLLYKIINNFNLKNEYIISFLTQIGFKLSVLLKYDLLTIKLFKRSNEQLVKLGCYEKLNENKLFYARSLVNNKLYEEAIDILNNIETQKEEVYLEYFYIYQKINDNSKCVDYLKKIKKKKYLLKSKYELYNIFNLENLTCEKNRVMKEIGFLELENYDELDLNKLKLYELKSRQYKYEAKDILKNDIIEECFKTCNFRDLERFSKELISLYLDSYSYKQVYLLNKKIETFKEKVANNI